MLAARLRIWCTFFFFQAEDGIRYLVRSRGLGDVYKRQAEWRLLGREGLDNDGDGRVNEDTPGHLDLNRNWGCLLYTSDAADERSSVDLGGRRIIKKITIRQNAHASTTQCTIITT